MESINEYMMRDHRRCDSIFERAERAASAADFAALEREAGEFLHRIGVHIDMEERLLFPEFEKRTGMYEGGPSATMRDEHRRMEEMFAQMRSAIVAKDAAAYQAASAALIELLTQHNQKEESMMYPMLEDAVGADAQALLDEVKAMAVQD